MHFSPVDVLENTELPQKLQNEDPCQTKPVSTNPIYPTDASRLMADAKRHAVPRPDDSILQPALGMDASHQGLPEIRKRLSMDEIWSHITGVLPSLWIHIDTLIVPRLNINHLL